MSYWNSTGKYQKAYDYLYDKLIPKSGSSRHKYGELLRVLGRYYYRYYNDGDDYYAMIEEGTDFTNNCKMPAVERENVESMLDGWGHYKTILEDTVNYVLVRTMLNLSTPTKIYNPLSNRLVNINSVAGIKAQSLLDHKITCLYKYKENVGLDEPLSIKFKKANKYKVGQKYTLYFDYIGYVNYFTSRNLKYNNEYDDSYCQTNQLNLLRNLIITTKSIPFFKEELNVLTHLTELLKENYKVNNNISHLRRKNTTSSNTIKINSLKEDQHKLNKQYKSYVSDLSSMFDKSKFTEKSN